MSWNYRLVDHGSYLAVHECFYTKAGEVDAWTKLPVTFIGDTLEEITVSLERALHDARAYPVLKDEPPPA
jgi:hypothetical protein